MRFSIRKIILVVTILNLGIFLVFVYFTSSSTVVETLNPLIQKETPLGLTTKASIRRNVSTIRYQKRYSGDCMELKRPVNVFETETWQKVGDGVKNYMFSAYFDDILSPMVRIIGLKEKKSNQNLYCQLWFNDTVKELEVVPIKLKLIPEDHSKRYAANFYLCSLERQDRIPYAVSVVTSKCEKSSNVLAIQSKQKQIWKFSLCLTPFSLRYSRAYELVEMIEFNRILGVQQFFFYNYSTGVNVDRVLEDYIAEGVVKVIQWHLPVLVNKWPQDYKEEIHYFGQLACLNECLYRNLYASKYVVFTDLDEFIVPRKVNNLQRLMESVDTGPKQYGAFLFRCVFFRKDWPDIAGDFKGRSLAEKYKSVTLLTVDRERHIWPAYQRSKYIAKPIRVEVVGIHTIWKWRQGYSAYTVDTNDARLHHYRNWENPTDQQPKETDLIVHEQFKSKIVTVLDSRWNRLPYVLLDIPITNYTFPL